MKKHIVIQLVIAFLFTFMGGYCDGYTYLTRNGIFSHMQTGNLIKFCIAVANGYFEYPLLIPIIFFCLGCIAATFIGKLKYCTYITTTTLAITFFACSFCPLEKTWNIVAVSILSFVAALQFQAFNRCLNYHYTSTMCTNNMRLLSNNIAHRNLKKVAFYFSIILCFALGVVTSTFVVKIMDFYALAPSALIFIVILVLLFVDKNEIKIDSEEIND